MPTIIFWNPENNELCEDAIPYFELLRKVSIFHDTPESAMEWLDSVYDNIDEWWFSPEVQSARKLFCEKFAKIPNDFIRDLDKVIDKAVDG